MSEEYVAQLNPWGMHGKAKYTILDAAEEFRKPREDCPNHTFVFLDSGKLFVPLHARERFKQRFAQTFPSEGRECIGTQGYCLVETFTYDNIRGVFDLDLVIDGKDFESVYAFWQDRDTYIRMSRAFIEGLRPFVDFDALQAQIDQYADSDTPIFVSDLEDIEDVLSIIITIPMTPTGSIAFKQITRPDGSVVIKFGAHIHTPYWVQSLGQIRRASANITQKLNEEFPSTEIKLADNALWEVDLSIYSAHKGIRLVGTDKYTRCRHCRKFYMEVLSTMRKEQEEATNAVKRDMAWMKFNRAKQSRVCTCGDGSSHGGDYDERRYWIFSYVNGHGEFDERKFRKLHRNPFLLLNMTDIHPSSGRCVPVPEHLPASVPDIPLVSRDCSARTTRDLRRVSADVDYYVMLQLSDEYGGKVRLPEYLCDPIQRFVSHAFGSIHRLYRSVHVCEVFTYTQYLQDSTGDEVYTSTDEQEAKEDGALSTLLQRLIAKHGESHCEAIQATATDSITRSRKFPPCSTIFACFGNQSGQFCLNKWQNSTAEERRSGSFNGGCHTLSHCYLYITQQGAQVRCWSGNKYGGFSCRSLAKAEKRGKGEIQENVFHGPVKPLTMEIYETLFPSLATQNSNTSTSLNLQMDLVSYLGRSFYSCRGKGRVPVVDNGPEKLDGDDNDFHPDMEREEEEIGFTGKKRTKKQRVR